jgi:hypothetical protein
MFLTLKSRRRLRELFKVDKVTIDADSKIIFVCGASNSKDNNAKTRRQLVIEYGKQQFDNFRFLQAENAFRYLRGSINSDLLTIENKLAEFSDCIIVILESEGAIAEVGAFANHDEIRKFLLVIINEKYSNDDHESFIKNGPNELVDSNSSFAPALYVKWNIDEFTSSLQPLADRFNKVLVRKNSTGIDISNYSNFKNCGSKVRMFVLADLISLFSPISYDELIDIL